MALPFWRSLFFLAFVLLGYTFWTTLTTLHERWTQFSHSLSHGYLLIAVAFYLIWQTRDRLGSGWRPNAWLGLLLLLGASFFWFVGFATQLTLAQQMAVPAIVWLCLVVALGWQAGWQLALPAAIIYFGVPLWDFLVEPLQALTVHITEALLRLLQIPAFVHRFYIELPNGSFEVAGGCSGLNYLLVGLVIGVLHAYLNINGWGRRVAAVLLVVGLALLSNWIRVFALVIIGYMTDMQSSLIEDHDGFGWIIFACALVVFFLLSRWLFERGGAIAAPKTNARPVDWRLAAVRLWLATAVAVALPLWAQWSDGQLKGGTMTGLAALDAQFASPMTPAWQPAYRGYDVAQAWRVDLGRQGGQLVALTWHTQEHDRKLIYYANRLAEEGRLLKTLQPVSGAEVTLNRSVVRDGLSQRLVWWFYLVGDQTASGALEAKIRQLPAWLSGDPRAAIVALSIKCHSANCADEQDDRSLQQKAVDAIATALATWRSDPA